MQREEETRDFVHCCTIAANEETPNNVVYTYHATARYDTLSFLSSAAFVKHSDGCDRDEGTSTSWDAMHPDEPKIVRHSLHKGQYLMRT